MRNDWTRRSTFVAMALALALIAVACGDTGSVSTGDSPGTTATTAGVTTTLAGDSTTTSTGDTTTITTGGATTTTTAGGATTTTTAGATTTTTVGTTTTTLPGEPFDIGPAEGDVIAVVGVAFDDVLNVRDVPAGSIVARLDPLADDVVATGRARMLPSTIWWEVNAGSTTGWSSAAFLGWLGDVTDETSAIVALAGEIPTADSMFDLGLFVANLVASVDPASSIVETMEAGGEHDLGEVIIDVIGLGDDSVLGFRLHVFGTPSETESGTRFSLKSVEQTLICSRGVSGGLCV